MPPSLTAIAARTLAVPFRTRPTSRLSAVVRSRCWAASISSVPRLHLQTRQQQQKQQCDCLPQHHSSLLLTRRCYHSTGHPEVPPPQDSFSSVEQAILTAAYRHIPEHGFTEQAISLGSRDAGYLDISPAILPDGVFSLVRWHLVSQRLNLAPRSREIFGADEPDVPPRARAEVLSRAERLAWERLLGNKDVVARWQEALAIMAQPSYVAASLRELALLSDEIWALAGDASIDPSWYTKRASLSAIYASSELFMTTDHDPDFAATHDFLHRRFHEAEDLGGYVRTVGQWVGFAANASVNVLRSKGLGI